MITHSYIFQNNVWDNDPFQLEDSENNLVLIFGNHQDEALKIITHYKNSIIAGGSSVAILAPSSAQLKDALIVSIMRFERTKVRAAHATASSYETSKTAAEEVVKELDKYDNLQGVLTFSDFVMRSGTQYTLGLQFKNNKNVPLAGCVTSAKELDDTFVYSNKGIEKFGAIGIGLYGDHIFFSASIGAGSKPFGIERKATRCVENILYEIDGAPAYDLYREYLPLDADSTREQYDVVARQFPIGVTKDLELQEDYVRTPVGLTEDGTGIILAGEIKEGATIRLMRATMDNFLDGAEKAAEEVFEDGRPANADNFRSLIINCEARRAIVGEFIEDEVAAINRTLDVKSIGTTYSFGEICHNKSGCSLMHTQTIVICVFGET